ncbi:hypothetical protein A2U01_0039802, partial [Trifolium medium]|nr:hypothetical protein [Trifolium medium]
VVVVVVVHPPPLRLQLQLKAHVEPLRLIQLLLPP